MRLNGDMNLAFMIAWSNTSQLEIDCVQEREAKVNKNEELQ